tara:strand:+ start:100 stop:648 length:549 start_codon:yes stop_codon:yes gene_type:complete
MDKRYSYICCLLLFICSCASKPNEPQFRGFAKRQLSRIIDNPAVIYGTVQGDLRNCDVIGTYTGYKSATTNVSKTFKIRTQSFRPSDQSFEPVENFFFQVVPAGQVTLNSVTCSNNRIHYIMDKKITLAPSELHFVGNLKFKSKKKLYYAESFKTNYDLERDYGDTRPTEAINRLFKVTKNQ